MLTEYKTDRLVLRILRSEEAPMVLDFYERDKEYFEQFEADRLDNFYTIPFQKAALRYEYNAAAEGSMKRFYVFLKEDPHTIIGTICFHDIKRSAYNSCEIGYKFSSDFQHKGYASEAMAKVLDIIFFENQLHRVYAYVLTDNEASRKMLTRLNFTEECICREIIFLHRKWRDHYQYAINANEWITNK